MSNSPSYAVINPVIIPSDSIVSASSVYTKPVGVVKLVQVVRPVKVELIAFKSPLIIWFAVKVFDEVNFAVPFKLVSIPDILYQH